MVDPADVVVDRAPVVDQPPVERRRVVVRVDVAEEVPGRVDEGVHRVGLAPAGLAAPRAGRVASTPRCSRAAASPSGGSPRPRGAGAATRRRGRGRAAVVAVDDRDRAAPVALPAEAPVAQAVADRRRAPALSSRATRRSPSSPPRRAGRRTRPELTSVPSSVDDLDDRQVERLGELAVALVVRGHGHDRAGAVVHQHVVGDPDRQPRAVHRVRRVVAGEDAGLRLLGGALLVSLRARSRGRIVRPRACRSARRAGARARARRRSRRRACPGRVVKTGMSVSSSSIRKRISAPSLRPIQLRWIVIVRSGQSAPCEA